MEKILCVMNLIKSGILGAGQDISGLDVATLVNYILFGGNGEAEDLISFCRSNGLNPFEQLCGVKTAEQRQMAFGCHESFILNGFKYIRKGVQEYWVIPIEPEKEFRLGGVLHDPNGDRCLGDDEVVAIEDGVINVVSTISAPEIVDDYTGEVRFSETEKITFHVEGASVLLERTDFCDNDVYMSSVTAYPDGKIVDNYNLSKEALEAMSPREREEYEELQDRVYLGGIRGLISDELYAQWKASRE